jgi:membrane-associated protease RseP (regulator of RpoE activity)
MLGIVGGDELDTKIAAELGVPVGEGIRLDGLVEGMGAQAAGLQKDDVIVHLGGQPITGWQTLLATLGTHQAGDKVQVSFYRGPNQHTVTLELSRRPMPDVPPTAKALAETIRGTDDELDTELARLFEGVTEAEASHEPAPGEWSAKQIIAHLIAAKRDTQVQIAALITGDELNAFTSNETIRVKGLASAFPTVPDLLAELKRAETETVAMLAALPEEFVARKSSYVRLGTELLSDGGLHTRGHCEQIRAAIEAARKG